MARELSEVIQELAEGPAEVQNETGRVRMPRISDVIEADQYAKATSAASTPHRGIRITKLLFPGAV